MCGLLMVFGEQISQEMPNDKVQIEVDSKLDSSKIFSTNDFYIKCHTVNLCCQIYGVQFLVLKPEYILLTQISFKIYIFLWNTKRFEECWLVVGFC